LLIGWVKTGNKEVIDTETKAVLCMKWLNAKLTASKQKAAQRIAAVFDEFQTTKSVARATVMNFHTPTMASLGRQSGLYIESGLGRHEVGSMSSLLPALQAKHNAVFALLTSDERFIYPVAAYRSGGKAGLNPHIYLFLPGVGELKGIKPKNFKRIVDTTIKLTNEKSIIGLNIMPVRSSNATDENVYDNVAEDEDVYDDVVVVATGATVRHEYEEVNFYENVGPRGNLGNDYANVN